jgi:hypothetical protein
VRGSARGRGRGTDLTSGADRRGELERPRRTARGRGNGAGWLLAAGLLVVVQTARIREQQETPPSPGGGTAEDIVVFRGSRAPMLKIYMKKLLKI